jgi:hypothetical protein
MRIKQLRTWTTSILLLSVAFIACKKSNLDLNKYDNLKIKPEVLVPLAQISTNAWDLLKNVDSIRRDGDGLIRFVVSDSLGSIGADSILKQISLPSADVKFKLGEISIPINSLRDTKKLSYFVINMDDELKNYFLTNNNRDTLFPAVDLASFSDNSTLTLNNFEMLKLSNGKLFIEIRNDFPVEFSEVSFTLYNSDNNTEIGNTKFNFLKPGDLGTDSIDLKSKILKSKIYYKIDKMQTVNSSGNVRINLNDSLGVKISGSGMKCVGGKAEIPSQNMPTQLMHLNMSSQTDDYKIRNILFGNAAIPFTAESKFAENFELAINFPDATVGGSPLTNTNITLPTGSKSGVFDLSNAKVFLGAVDTLTHNMLRVSVQPSITSSGKMVLFDSSDFVKISVDPSAIELKYVDGYLGSRSFSLSDETISFPDLERFAKGITLTNPKMTIRVKNSFGLPIQVNLELVAKNDKGTTVDVDPDSMVFGFPSIADAGTTVSSTFSIDKDNSNIVPALALPPTEFMVKGTAYINKEGFKGYNDFVGDYSRLSLAFEANVPMSLMAKDIIIQDTSNDVSSTLDGAEAFEFLELKIKTINGFPMDGTLDLIFVDSAYNALDSVTNTTLIASGVPNATGDVITATENNTSFLLSNSILQNIGGGKCKYILFKIKLNTYSNGSVSVNVKAENRLFVALAFRGKLSGQ